MSSLTLGILTFNDGEYLQKLLNSVESQNDKDFELLIINNSPADLTQAIINNFIKTKHDFKIRNFDNNENIGSFLGTRQLILNAVTSHISIIHGDDLLKNDYVKLANKYIKLYPDYCAFNFDLEEIEDDQNLPTGNVIKSSWTKFKILNRLLVSGLNPGVMPGAVINKTLLTKHFLSSEFENSNLNGTEDIFLWQQIVRSSEKVMRVPIVTYFYRRHSGQISRNFTVYGLSLGYARRVNFYSAKTIFEKLLCVSEIAYELSSVQFESSYLSGLNQVSKYTNFSKFRFLNIFIRRIARLVNYFTYNAK